MNTTMVTYGSPEMVDVEVTATVRTIKTRARPQDESRIVDRFFDPVVIEGFEVKVGDTYRIRVGGQFVHEFDHDVDDTDSPFTMAELPDGTRHMSTRDGLFAMTQGRAGTRVTLRDQAEWSRFGWHVEGDRVGWAIGSGVFDSRKVLQ
ncbi:hypothetical protein SEA_KEITABEAR_7 [Gordonia phage Keitabear]|uniref:Uncharacterized protein n=1 Tax=Gordonia phage Keitabear TaxID=2653274 RepID=A0A5P8D7X4_9CAUD|nr:hypothetical protein KNU77_gp07 [Gordonia phage Keitabear]QFP94449.1 hypothetical protein SEA_KEITABEAR_7 [Gordonia phage Keitabear]QWT30138.1 hypothetical protein SEA_SEDONA_8 [Gordonia phage Sedona]